ncbi:hypothetical protein P0I75_001513 [Campylobacter fetus]|nr:hypothetical protein [Campylobacter fetus]KAA3683182.1 hypothetical protein E3G72_07385 [Campylobacter fetus subsp. fetus]MBD3866275.1 hypothetical protein [Campylobacter fetus]
MHKSQWGGGIEQNSPVLLACDSCSHKTRAVRKKLISNLENLNIKWADGFEFIADELLKFENINLENSVAILTTALFKNRHYGSIFDILLKNKVNIFIVNSYIQNYKNDKGFMGLSNILIPTNSLKYYKFKIVLSSVNLSYQNVCFTHKNSFAMVFSHHLTMLRSFIFTHKICDISKQESIDTFGSAVDCYYVAMMKSDHKYFNALNSKAKLLNLGYPSIDEQIKSYIPNNPQKCVLVLFRHSKAYEKIIEVMDKLLNLGYEVIFRPVPTFENNSDNLEIKNHFLGRKNFTYDTDPKISNQTLQKSMCAIGDYSSTIFSFPFTTLRPCLLFYPTDIMGDKFEIETINGKTLSLADKNLHIVSRTADELIQNIENLNLDEWKERILNYRNSEIYNLGHSSEAIAQFILDKIKP